jgi:hypothetical protein
MTPERWQRVAQLFEAFSDRPAAERDALLDEACGDDAALRREVEALLAQDDEPPGVLDRPVWVPDDLATPPGALTVGTVLGTYRIDAVPNVSQLSRRLERRIFARTGRRRRLQLLVTRLSLRSAVRRNVT